MRSPSGACAITQSFRTDIYYILGIDFPTGVMEVNEVSPAASYHCHRNCKLHGTLEN